MLHAALPAGLTDRERIDRLRLIRSENVGPITWQRLIERYHSATRALAILPELAAAGGRRTPLRIASTAAAEAELAAVDRLGGRILVWGEADYPPHLAAIDDAPPTLSLLGDATLLARRSVAIVGSRNASVNGRQLAGRLAADLAAAGFVIVSGLARGIDGAAHGGALAGGTIAVVAGGIDIIYPEEHAALYQAIRSQGAVVAELPPATQPQARHFPRRNRIIAGLAEAVLVVEAAMKSGSLITARYALEQGRDVFAVPGSPLDARARGANDLIRQGATLTETADDVLNGLAPLMHLARAPAGKDQPLANAAMLAPNPPPESPPEPRRSDDQAQRILAEALSPSPVTVDALIRACDLPASAVTGILLEWELAGRVERHAGNRVSLLASPGNAIFRERSD